MANGIYDLISKGFPSTYAAANSFYNSKEYQDAKNYAAIPATYGAALYGNYINKNVGENMARAFRTDDMNKRLSQQVGNQLPPGVNSGSLTYTNFGLDPVREYLGGGEYRNTREFNAPSFEKFMSLNSADAANALTQGNLNFTRDPSGNINYTGNRFDFPQPTFMNNNPMDIPLDELNVNAPEFRFTDYLQGKYDFNKFEELPSAGIAYSELDDFEAQNAGSFIPKEEKGILSLRDILADLGRKGVEGFKDIASRGVASQALGTAGAMFNPYLGLAGMVFGGLKGGDLFQGSHPSIAAIAQPGNPEGLQMRRDATSISRMLNRKSKGKGYGINRLNNIFGKFGFNVKDKTRADYVDIDGMSDSIAQSAKTGYGGYGSSDAAAAAAAAGGRDYSESPGAMAGDMEYGEE